MATDKQKLGDFGEEVVVKSCLCPKCKKGKTLKLLPKNFKCADVVCDFCGYLAQVKAKTVKNISVVPKQILGAAWKPQEERMQAGIYFPLFIVLVCGAEYSIFYLSADLQTLDMFVARKPLSENAKRAGWQGFLYNMEAVPTGAVVRLI